MSRVSKLLPLVTSAAACLALAACGHSDKANAPASADNVEMPAEEAMSGIDATATPQPDPSATATEAVDSSGAIADSAASPGDAASSASSSGQ